MKFFIAFFKIDLLKGFKNVKGEKGKNEKRIFWSLNGETGLGPGLGSRLGPGLEPGLVLTHGQCWVGSARLKVFRH